MEHLSSSHNLIHTDEINNYKQLRILFSLKYFGTLYMNDWPISQSKDAIHPKMKYIWWPTCTIHILLQCNVISDCLTGLLYAFLRDDLAIDYIYMYACMGRFGTSRYWDIKCAINRLLFLRRHTLETLFWTEHHSLFTRVEVTWHLQY